MTNDNYDILVQNIKKLMKDKGVTQEKLGTELSMPQSNVSKALSRFGGKCFTLEQVIGISKYFNVSIDKLLGNQRSNINASSPRGIGTFLSEVLESHTANYSTIEQKETVWELDEAFPQQAEEKERIVTYTAIYFPSYWRISDYASEKEEAYWDATQHGNASDMKPVNDFLRQFIEILRIYENGSLSEETYRSVLTDLLGHLRE